MGGSQWRMHAGPLAVFVAVEVAVEGSRPGVVAVGGGGAQCSASQALEQDFSGRAGSCSERCSSRPAALLRARPHVDAAFYAQVIAA